MPRIEKIINSKENDLTVHLVLGHRQIRGCENICFEEKDLNFPINWFCVSNGYPQDFLNILEDEIKTETRPLKVTGMFSQNDIPSISLDSVRYFLKRTEMLKESECLFDRLP